MKDSRNIVLCVGDYYTLVEDKFILQQVYEVYSINYITYLLIF